VNTISGRSEPELAAAKGFEGISDTRKSTKPGSSGADCAAASGAVTPGAKASPRRMAPIPSRIAGSTVIQKNPSVSTPNLPSFFGFPSRATPEKITAMTRGITTMRIAFMNAVPRGAEAWAIPIRVSEPVAAARRPKPRPATRPIPIAR